MKLSVEIKRPTHLHSVRNASLHLYIMVAYLRYAGLCNSLIFHRLYRIGRQVQVRLSNCIYTSLFYQRNKPKNGERYRVQNDQHHVGATLAVAQIDINPAMTQIEQIFFIPSRKKTKKFHFLYKNLQTKKNKCYFCSPKCFWEKHQKFFKNMVLRQL